MITFQLPRSVLFETENNHHLFRQYVGSYAHHCNMMFCTSCKLTLLSQCKKYTIPYCSFFPVRKKIEKGVKTCRTDYYILISLLILLILRHNKAGQFNVLSQNFALLYVMKKFFVFLRPSFEVTIPKHCLKGLFPWRVGKDANFLLCVINSTMCNIVF